MVEPRTIVFVCEHGAAKSVLAAALLERYASGLGTPVRALARGTNPEPQLSAVATSALLAEGVDVRHWKPRQIKPSEIASAWRVVSFGPDLTSVAADMHIEHWPDVPNVDAGVEAAKTAITILLAALLDSVREPA
jgi:arsenate reductase